MAESGEAHQFIAALEAHFSALHTEVVERLREVISMPLPESAECLYFTYFCDSFEEMALPVTVNAIRQPDDLGWVDWPGMSSEPMIPSALLNRFPEYGDSFDPYSIAIKLTGEALLRAWIDAEGQMYQHPAYFAEHDDVERLNLQTGKWESSL